MNPPLKRVKFHWNSKLGICWSGDSDKLSHAICVLLIARLLLSFFSIYNMIDTRIELIYHSLRSSARILKRNVARFCFFFFFCFCPIFCSPFERRSFIFSTRYFILWKIDRRSDRYVRLSERAMSHWLCVRFRNALTNSLVVSSPFLLMKSNYATTIILSRPIERKIKYICING